MLDHYEAEMKADKAFTPEPKAGRRLSANTKAVLQQALDLHAAGMKAVQDLMEAGEEPSDDIDEPDELTPEPFATDIPDDMTPEQRRLKEARELKASLTPND